MGRGGPIRGLDFGGSRVSAKWERRHNKECNGGLFQPLEENEEREEQRKGEEAKRLKA
jgi:hypothetical protein